MGEKKYYGLPNRFSDDIWQFRLGRCTLVIARMYGILGLISMALISSGYVYYRPYSSLITGAYSVPEETKLISATWIDFLADCGGELIVENYVRARSLFNRKYENNQVLWTGHFIDSHTSSNQDGVTYLLGTSHKMTLSIKMSPSESELYPDLALSVSTSLFDKNKDLFLGLNTTNHRPQLKRGDELLFRAKFVTLGDEFKVHHLHLMEIEPTGERKDLSDIIVKTNTLP
jgi:hypothetical protein